MKLLYIDQHLVTHEGTSHTRSYDVSRYLVKMGHDVTAVCCDYDQNGLPRMQRRQLFRVQWREGVKIVTCNAFYSNNQDVPARLWSFLKFAILATVACLRETSVDLVFASSTPLTVGIPGRFASSIKRVPYIFEVRDLWPEDLLAAGRIKPGWQFRIWRWLEHFSYTTASKILVVSRGFHNRLLERGFAPERIKTILLGADGKLYENPKPDWEFMERHGLAGKTIAVYAGAHGDANGLFQLIEAARYLKKRPDIAIVLIGEGKMRDSLNATIVERGLTNIRLLDPVPKHRLPDILAACHIGLMILKPISRPRWVTPNKIFDYMFAGLPILVNFSGTTAELVPKPA